MEHKQQWDKKGTGYFGNIKTRLGSRIPSGVSRPPGYIAGPRENMPAGMGAQAGPTEGRAFHAPARPLDHVPHIRNPRLRQYYLRETAWLPEDITAKSGKEEGVSKDTDDNHLRVPESKASSLAMNPDPNTRPGHGLEPELDPQASPTPSASPLSPSPDADYDKLLDVEAVPMPDGQLCLLALPPECSEGEGPEAIPYLKLCGRYITDRKGVVSGVLLVTSKKIFFDPYKSHPLVKENGWEEYLLSCSVDSLLSVYFCSNVSNVHFSSSTPRGKDRKRTHKTAKNLARKFHGAKHNNPPQQKVATFPALVTSATMDLRSTLGLTMATGPSDDGESRDIVKTERQLGGSPLEELAVQSAGPLGVAVLSSAATFCCGGQEAGGKVTMELEDTNGTEQPAVKNKPTGCMRAPPGGSGDLMFVRLRVQQPPGPKKGVVGLELGKPKTPPPREIWFTLSQESADELYAYLSHWRPDLCIIEGGEEADMEEEEYVLVNDEEEETQKDWEIVSVEDGEGRLPLGLDREPEGLSNILRQSQILQASHVLELFKELPPRTVGCSWHLAFSTSCHGSSLKSLYRKLSGSDSPTLIVIKDSHDQVFGSFLSHALRPSETFYGTGETFLFMLHPRFKCFRWTGENSFFIKGDLDSFAVGGGSGHFGLWLDETLYLGRSSPCYTFNNCCLSDTDDFRVMELEVWTFC